MSKAQEDSDNPPMLSGDLDAGDVDLLCRPERIYLVGMPGSGKSSSGRLLARLLGYAFEDLDTAIEQAAGMSVRELFAVKGEGFFRELETNCLEQFHARTGLVLATGGGTVLNNMDRMLQQAMVLWLDIPVDVLIHRISTGAERRPMFRELSRENLELKVWELFRQRKSLYALAHRRVSDEQALLDWGHRVLFLPNSSDKSKG